VHDTKEHGVLFVAHASQLGPTKAHPEGKYTGTPQSMEHFLTSNMLVKLMERRGWGVGAFCADGDGGEDDQMALLNNDAQSVGCANHASKNQTKSAAAIGNELRTTCSCPQAVSKNGKVLRYKDHLAIDAVTARKVGKRVRALLGTQGMTVETFQRKLRAIPPHFAGICGAGDDCDHPPNYITRQLITCHDMIDRLSAQMESLAKDAHKYISKSGDTLTTNLAERLHALMIHYRNKDISLSTWHYVLKTNMAVCHLNQTVMHE
jgi:hypothetical protein